MRKNWEHALMKVCECYLQSDENIDWILVGSVGSVLQGCDMEPGDVDIYVKNAEDVGRFSDLLSEYALPNKSSERNSNDWLSSIEEPVFTETFSSGFSWSKARWNIDGFQVEVVHISNSAGIPDSLTGDGIWEGGRYIWSLAKYVRFGDYTIPTVPLEIQLESNLRRKRHDRVEAILNTLNNKGYDKELITKALSTPNVSYFLKQISHVSETYF